MKNKAANLKYIIFKLSEDMKEIDIDKEATGEATFAEFSAHLLAAGKARECRYAVYDAHYTNKAEVKKDKVLFFHWGPDHATIKQKMVYASSKEAFKNALEPGIHVIQCSDDDTLCWEDIEKDLISKDRT